MADLPGIRVRVVGDADLEAATADVQQFGNSVERVQQQAARVPASLSRASSQARGFGQNAQFAGGHTANLAAQFNDIGVMLASGQSPMLLAMQQGTQVNQVLGQMGTTGASRLRALGVAFASVVSPANILTLGIIAGGAALFQWAVNAGRSRRATESFEDALGNLDSAFADVERQQRTLTELRTQYVQAVVAGQAQIAAAISQEIELRNRLLAVQRVELENRLRSAQAAREATQARVDAVYDEIRARTQMIQVDRDTSALEVMQERRRLTWEILDANEALLGEYRLQSAEIDLMEFQIGAIDGHLEDATDQANLLTGAAAGTTTELERTAAAAAAVAANLAQAERMGLSGGVSGPDAAISDLYNSGQLGGVLSGVVGRTRVNGETGAGGGGTDAFAGRIAALTESLMTERETIDAWYEESQELLANANAAELEAIGGHNEARLRLEEEYQERLAGIRDAGHGDALTSILNSGQQIATAIGQTNERAMRVAQAFGAAEALVNAYRAASQALADPSLPWFAKVSAAASVLAAGIGFANSIRSVSASGAGGAGGGAGATSAATAAPAPLEVRLANIDPSALYSGADVDELLNRLMDAAGDRGLSIVTVAA